MIKFSDFLIDFDKIENKTQLNDFEYKKISQICDNINWLNNESIIKKEEKEINKYETIIEISVTPRTNNSELEPDKEITLSYKKK